MGELERLLGPQRAQRLDDAEAHAAAAVHGDARGLVEHQQLLVLVHDRPLRAARRAPLPGAPAPRAVRRAPAGYGCGPRAAARSCGSARRPLTRTSPLRMRRYRRLRGTPGSSRCRQLSRRWPASSSPTSQCCTPVRVSRGSGADRGVLGVRHCFYNGLEYTLCVVRQVRTRQWLAAMAAARLVGPLKPRPSLGPPRPRQLRRTPHITEFRSERRRLSSPKVTFPSARLDVRTSA